MTSRPEDAITKMFPDSVNIHVNISSDSEVKLEDSASDNIHAFFKSRFDTMRMEPAWIVRALNYLVPCASGIFIWATTVTEFLEFLEVDSQAHFFILQSQGDRKGLGNMYSLYSTAIKTSFGCDLKGEEIEVVTSAMSAMIFAKKPLNNDMLIMLPGVKIPDSDLDMLQFI